MWFFLSFRTERDLLGLDKWSTVEQMDAAYENSAAGK